MELHISREQARQFLTNYHFTQTDLPGLFARLGTVQYDPLRPVGRNPDLVIQARVPGYHVDDWQEFAYTQRLAFDAWDKQACLVPISDWPMRVHTRDLYRPYHDREILQADPEGVATIYSALDERGPLSSQDFESDSGQRYDASSWYGSTRARRLLRAMWACGLLVTHHRQAGRHYYDRPERVIPDIHYRASGPATLHEYHKWIIARRFQAVGLLRAGSDASIWSACGSGPERKLAIAELVEEEVLLPVFVGEERWPYFMPASALPFLDVLPSIPRMIFLGPLDSLLWDRKGLLQLFGFDYVWEVYKPATQRRWGYYVLPVFYGDRFIGRLDSRLDNGVWHLSRWWWEENVAFDDLLLAALRSAITQFLAYLSAQTINIAPEVDALIQRQVVQI